MLAVCLTAAVALAACGDDADTTAAVDTPTAEETETSATASGSGDGEVHTVTGVDYGFQGLEDEFEVGTELAFHNDSDGGEVHELVLVRVPDDEVRSAEELLALPQEESNALIGPNLVGVSVAMPGEEGRVVEGDLVLDEPGRYLALCFIQTGVDPEVYAEAAAESQGGPVELEDGGPPHVANGMVAEFTVAAG